MATQEAIMTTEEIASRLVKYCRKADWESAHDELYAENASSTEPYETPDFEKEVHGLDAIREKGRKFTSLVEKMHAIEVSDPLIAGNTIAFTMTMDVTMKGKERMKSPELCLYQVKDGKIISEAFLV